MRVWAARLGDRIAFKCCGGRAAPVNRIVHFITPEGRRVLLETDNELGDEHGYGFQLEAMRKTTKVESLASWAMAYDESTRFEAPEPANGAGVELASPIPVRELLQEEGDTMSQVVTKAVERSESLGGQCIRIAVTDEVEVKRAVMILNTIGELKDLAWRGIGTQGGSWTVVISEVGK